MPYRDRERRRAYGREWIRRNAEKAREAMRRWRRNHRDEHNREKRGYYARHRDKLKLKSVEYHRRNPDVRRTAAQRRRGRELEASGSYTTAQWRALLQEFGGRCVYCGANGPLHVDHRVPLSRRGTNDIGNILPACARCNQQKHTMTDLEFLARMAREAPQCRLHGDFFGLGADGRYN